MWSVTHHLNLLVSLAGEQHNVTRPRLLDCQRNGSTAVHFDDVPRSILLQADQSIVDDGRRIFAAGIIRRQHRQIAPSPRSLAHQRTLRTIAISAATEHGYYPGAS